tara:strand:+ start:562 stop:1074 length:513 start_codon:yes stop_codon:yes gene_type:complete
MFTLGIPQRQYRRCTQVLGPESAEHIPYESHKQDDGFYLFSFPGLDEDGFKSLVILLKNNGITPIGADNHLTERNIMKLTDLLKEQPSPDENNLIDILKQTLESWEKPTYRGGIDGCEKSNHYFEDIKDIIEDYTMEEETYVEKTQIPSTKLSAIQEKKLRKLIRKTIRE